MRVALVHDHLAQDGGAEKVLRVFAEMFPEAPIYTLLYEEDNVNKYFKDKNIQPSIIQKMPGGVKHYKWYMPFMPMAVEFFDMGSYDIVLSDASAFAKGVITHTNTLHICYCHTPTRYLWDYTHKYINELRYNKYFKKAISLVLNYIRMWDKLASERVDKYIANSNTTKKRIAKFYRRDSDVIYPPVATDKFKISDNIEDYFLIGGRLAPYKRVDIVISAFIEMDLPLKIYGDGIDLERLKSLASGYEKIEFLGRVSDEELTGLYSHCQAFINPQIEDFGITVVEAMASGRPVIAYKKGGATETVIEGKTGVFFEQESKDALKKAVEKFQGTNFDPQEIRDHALKFSTDKFKEQIKSYIDNSWREFNLDE